MNLSGAVSGTSSICGPLGTNIQSLSPSCLISTTPIGPVSNLPRYLANFPSITVAATIAVGTVTEGDVDAAAARCGAGKAEPGIGRGDTAPVGSIAWSPG